MIATITGEVRQKKRQVRQDGTESDYVDLAVLAAGDVSAVWVAMRESLAATVAVGDTVRCTVQITPRVSKKNTAYNNVYARELQVVDVDVDSILDGP
jgi:hypothetical protein